MSTPNDTQAVIDGTHYKIGRHGRPFIWVCGAWVRSTKPAFVVQQAITALRRVAGAQA